MFVDNLKEVNALSSVSRAFDAMTLMMYGLSRFVFRRSRKKTSVFWAKVIALTVVVATVATVIGCALYLGSTPQTAEEIASRVSGYPISEIQKVREEGTCLFIKTDKKDLYYERTFGIISDTCEDQSYIFYFIVGSIGIFCSLVLLSAVFLKPLRDKNGRILR